MDTDTHGCGLPTSSRSNREKIGTKLYGYVLAKAILVFAPLRQFRHLQEASGKAFAAAVPRKAIIIRSGSAEAREEAALLDSRPRVVCSRSNRRRFAVDSTPTLT